MMSVLLSIRILVRVRLTALLKCSVKDYLLILAELVDLTKTHPHLVSAIGLCNFDAEHTQEACEYLIARTGKVGIVSNQVQVSS